MSRRLCAAALLAAAFFCTLLAVQALWIPAKAAMAQWLLLESWKRTEQGHAEARPWPWADTRGIALLRVPGHGIEQVVLAGDSGRNLAFGPVLAESLLDGRDWIISGHRDTHFRFLEGLAPGDALEVVFRGSTARYVVDRAEVIDSRLQQAVIEPGRPRVSLVTCYPFDAVSAGGPLRYVVTALPAAEPAVSRRPRASG